MSQSELPDDVDPVPGPDPVSGPDPVTEAGEASPAESGREDDLPEGATPGAAVGAGETLALADPKGVRRAPRYGRFAQAGVILGIVVCATFVLLFARPTEYISLPGVFLLVAVFTVPLFALLACLLALLLERRRSASGSRRTPGS